MTTHARGGARCCYVRATGETVCLICGQVILEQPPVIIERQDRQAKLDRIKAANVAERTHRCWGVRRQR